LLERHISSGGGNTVAGRGDDRDVVGRAVEQLRGGRAKFVGAGEEFVGREFPRMRFTGKPGNSGFDDRLHQRRHVGTVEVGDVVRDIEEMALAGEHGRRWSFAICLGCWN
jgi:hypothetical protein